MELKTEPVTTTFLVPMIIGAAGRQPAIEVVGDRAEKCAWRRRLWPSARSRGDGGAAALAGPQSPRRGRWWRRCATAALEVARCRDPTGRQRRLRRAVVARTGWRRDTVTHTTRGPVRCCPPVAGCRFPNIGLCARPLRVMLLPTDAHTPRRGRARSRDAHRDVHQHLLAQP